jgi:hypothetical protein
MLKRERADFKENLAAALASAKAAVRVSVS